MIHILTRSIRTFLCIGLITYFGQFSAHARLGESLEKCTERYGAPFGKIPARIDASNQFCYLFVKSLSSGALKRDIRIRIEFKDNQACYIRFSGMLSEGDIQSLLQSNQGESTWEGPETLADRSYWKTKGVASSFACRSKSFENSVLELYSDAAVSYLKETREARFTAALHSAGSSPTTSTEPSGQPVAPSKLEGF